MKTLIITDVQHDFMPGSVLGVSQADRIIPVINALLYRFEHVLATLDWHPPNHVSFAATHGKNPGDVITVQGYSQVLWPIHCVQNTHGANLAHGLLRDRIEATFHKGTDPKIDSYSVFFDNARHRVTGLEEYLKKNHLFDLYFVGIATDYCVLYSVLDALALGFQATVIRDACRAINLQPDDEEKAIARMKKQGAKISVSSEFL